MSILEAVNLDFYDEILDESGSLSRLEVLSDRIAEIWPGDPVAALHEIGRVVVLPEVESLDLDNIDRIFH